MVSVRKVVLLQVVLFHEVVNPPMNKCIQAYPIPIGVSFKYMHCLLLPQSGPLKCILITRVLLKSSTEA